MTTIRLRATEEAILTAVTTYHYLTIEQLTRLLHQGRSHTTVAARAKRLWEGQYLSRQHLSHRGCGSGALVYTVGSLGRRYLTALGWDIPRYRNDIKSDMHLRHTLSVTDVLITFAKLPSPYWVVTLLHEQDLKRLTISAYPDGWIIVAGAQGNAAGYLLELDRGTEKRLAWNRKIERLVALLDNRDELTRHFNDPHVPTVHIVTPDTFRCDTLQTWTKAALLAVGRRELCEYFLCLTFAEALDPEILATYL